MKHLSEQQLKTHVPIVAWLLIGLNSIVLLVALILFLVMASFGGLVREQEGRAVFLILGTALPAIMAMLTLPDFVAAYALLARKPWGRILGIVVGFLNLPGFPMGTLVGGYVIFVLLQDGAKSYFESPGSHLTAAPQPA